MSGWDIGHGGVMMGCLVWYIGGVYRTWGGVMMGCLVYRTWGCNDGMSGI